MDAQNGRVDGSFTHCCVPWHAEQCHQICCREPIKYVRSNVCPPTFCFDLKRLVGFSFPLFLQDTGNYVYAWFDQVALFTHLSLEGLGVYTTSMTAFGVLGGVAGAIGTSLFPTYSAMQGEHGSKVLSDSIRGATRYVCLIVMPLCFGLFSTAKPSLALFVGEAYANLRQNKLGDEM